MKPLRPLALCFSAGLAAAVLSPAINAAPVPGQITPVAVYLDINGAFGLAYDSANDRIWVTQGDFGDSVAHSVKPYKSYTVGEIAGLPEVGGVKHISNAAGEVDLAGTTTVAGGVHFRSLGFDSASGQLVAQGDGVSLKSFDPFTGGNLNGDYRPGTATDGFSDGLDVDGGDVWFSPDVGDIFKNGALFADNGDLSDTTLPGWAGLGGAVGLGWSGVERVGADVFAVAVQSGADTGRSRSIVKFDAATGALTGFDPDGDPVAARWEDLAFDGTYLYAADLRGDANGTGVHGDIYVFKTTGGIIIRPPGVPDSGSTVALLACALGGLFGLSRKMRG